MTLSFSCLPELQILAQLKHNPENEALFRRHVELYKQRIFEEMHLVYNDSAQTQEIVDTIIERLIAKVAELAIAGHILDKLVGDYAQWVDLHGLESNMSDEPTAG